MEKALIILGLAVIAIILVITVCSIFKKDSTDIEIEVVRPWNFKIKIKRTSTGGRMRTVHKKQRRCSFG